MRITFINLDDHIEDYREEFLKEARAYAAKYNVTFEMAQRDIRSEWAEGFADAAASLNTNDWDYGRE